LLILLARAGGVTAQVERLPVPLQVGLPVAAPPVAVGDPLRDAPLGQVPIEPMTDGPDQLLLPDPLPIGAAAKRSWFNPISWFLPRYWDNTLEIGLNSSRGNADAFSFRTGLELARNTPLTTWGVDITYAKNESGGLELQHNALAYSNWDLKLPGWKRWSVYWKSGLEYDEFKNFDVRYNTNGGLGFLLSPVDDDENKLRGRFGSGTSREFGGDDIQWHPEAAFGIDLTRRLTPRQKVSAVVDYFPTWTRFADYRIVSDIGWEIEMDQTDNLSLKINMIDRYDSTPNGARPNDVDYSVLVIWTL
jgi:hypothetical protein